MLHQGLNRIRRQAPEGRHELTAPLPGTLETPCVLIDLDRVERNLARARRHFDRLGIALRPHIKTHKLERFAHNQVELGARGITCQKLGEAEVMADAGLTDILLTYNILGKAKLERLKALARRVDIAVTADNAETVAGYAAAFDKARRPLPVLVECDTGGARCGVTSPPAALALARLIAQHDGLHFAGLMTYPPKHRNQETVAWLREARTALAELGLSPETVSVGGTPDMWYDWPSDIVTEYRPGNYIYMDRSQVVDGAAREEDCALSVLTTVVSRPTDTRVVIDAGTKALTSDLLGLDGFGTVPEFPEARIDRLTEEHGMIELGQPRSRPQIGHEIEIIPNHACPVPNLFDQVHLMRKGRLVDTVPVSARGRVT